MKSETQVFVVVVAVKGGLDAAAAEEAAVEIDDGFDGGFDPLKLDEDAHGLVVFRVRHLVNRAGDDVAVFLVAFLLRLWLQVFVHFAWRSKSRKGMRTDVLVVVVIIVVIVVVIIVVICCCCH